MKIGSLVKLIYGRCLDETFDDAKARYLQRAVSFKEYVPQNSLIFIIAIVKQESEFNSHAYYVLSEYGLGWIIHMNGTQCDNISK